MKGKRMFSHPLLPLQRHNRETATERKKRERGRVRAKERAGGKRETESRQIAREGQSWSGCIEQERNRKREKEREWGDVGSGDTHTHKIKSVSLTTHTGQVKQDTNNCWNKTIQMFLLFNVKYIQSYFGRVYISYTIICTKTKKL